ncbi:alpha/beta fold hydrolase [Roseateles sp. LYH14W]|uniref:Alpha/beta fold hydrolase n=1 Tax=Pelomonas parva TaxID=3299032 RepID=A0ABW7F604_9BURK
MKKIVWVLVALLTASALWVLVAIRTPARAAVCEGMRAGMRVHDAQSAQRLAIVLHGMGKTPSDVDPVAQTLLTSPQYQGTTRVVVPALPFSVLSTARAEDVTACLLEVVDQEWQARKTAGQPYQSVLLVGHSMGSLFARKLYVVARGELASAPFEKDLRQALGLAEDSTALVAPREWVAKVERIVLLGAINRGWSVDHHMPLLRMAQMQAGLAFNRFVQAVGGPPFAVMSTRKGAPFVTQLRLQWLEAVDCAGRLQAPTLTNTTGTRCQGGIDAPMQEVVQLLGTQDDLVRPGDSIDAVAGRKFAYIEVPHSDHGNVVDMAASAPAATPGQTFSDEELREQRRALKRAERFLAALDPQGDRDTPPELVTARGDPDFDVKHLVFVMHGIRDEGFWTERLGGRVRDQLLTQPDCQPGEGKPPCKVKLEVSSYGYFPMLSFLKPGARDEKVEWLMDRYAEARAQYPNAKFYYVGHSHGTYLLKEALKKYESVRFERVALAGSVLRTDQDWLALLKTGRIKGVLNLSADADWVVAFFPNALEQLGLQDMGGAGFYGFSKHDSQGFEQFPKDAASWVGGGHGAAVSEDWWDHVAGFIATGRRPTPDGELLREKPHWLVEAGGRVAPAIWLLLATVVVLGVWLIVRSKLREWAKTLALISYAGGVWFVLTSV